jgi:hypothetical protein
MPRTFYYLLALILLLAAVYPASAQVTTGTPPFGSFASGPDEVDLANLNIHLDIPVFSKPGRGLNFTYDMTYDSSVWFPATSGSTTTWAPVLNYGWSAQTQTAVGYISFTTISTYQAHPPCYITQYSNFVYYDASGTPHPFVGTAGHTVNPGSGCTATVTPLSAIATDASGYTLSANGNGGAYVVSKGGETLNVPLNVGTGPATVTDRNGNQMTADSSGDFYDTLSSTAAALVVSGTGTSSSPMKFTYTAPSMAPASFQRNYTNYTLATNFGFTGSIGEYKSAAAVPLVTSIVLPDGSQYSIQYESTPSTPSAGACTPYAGTTCVTGRIASVTLATAFCRMAAPRACNGRRRTRNRAIGLILGRKRRGPELPRSQ